MWFCNIGQHGASGQRAPTAGTRLGRPCSVCFAGKSDEGGTAVQGRSMANGLPLTL